MKRYFPLLIIIGFMVLAYFLGIDQYFSFETLKKQRVHLKNFVEHYPVLAPFCFIILYTISTALSLPGGALLSIFGGFLFDQPFAIFYVLVGATLGAILIFLAAKTALRDVLKEKAGPWLAKMQSGFQENATQYMLFLRLAPIFPFWLVNIAPAFFGVSLITFAWTTFVGIIPGAFVFTQAGAGLDSILANGETFSIQNIFTWDVKVALFALAIFSLLPILIKKIRRS